MNLGIKARGVLSHSGNTVETIVPLNHCSFNAGGIRNCAAGRQQNDLGTLDPPPLPQGLLFESLNCGYPCFGSPLKGKKWPTKTS